MFGENLKTLRKQKGFSQEELAARLHVVRQTVSKWEKGRSVPDADALIRLAEVLEVSVSVAAADLSPKNVPPARFLHGETHFGFKSLPLLIPKYKPLSFDGGLYFAKEQHNGA